MRKMTQKVNWSDELRKHQPEITKSFIQLTTTPFVPQPSIESGHLGKQRLADGQSGSSQYFAAV